MALIDFDFECSCFLCASTEYKAVFHMQIYLVVLSFIIIGFIIVILIILLKKKIKNNLGFFYKLLNKYLLNLNKKGKFFI